MLKKTLIATATAGLIAAGAMVGTASTASAASIHFNGPGWSFGLGDGHRWHPDMRQCRPIVRTVRWWDRWGNPHYRQVVVGRDCGWDHRGPRGDWNNHDRWGH